MKPFSDIIKRLQSLLKIKEGMPLTIQGPQAIYPDSGAEMLFA
jgi:hypothetical protein